MLWRPREANAAPDRAEIPFHILINHSAKDAFAPKLTRVNREQQRRTNSFQPQQREEGVCVKDDGHRIWVKGKQYCW